jgi:uncharacterized protein YdeI (YjbR/CyaY-like superfamily)
MAGSKHDKYPVMDFDSQNEFERWLSENHDRAEGIWLKMAKAKTGVTTVTYQQAVEVALCFGWIDGLARKLDEVYYVQKFTPRRARSIWSDINKKKVAVLIKEGRMREAGLAAIREAKKNGRWQNSYASAATIKVPPELLSALKKNKKAYEFFEKLDRTNRYAILFRLSQVKLEGTKKKKIAEYVKMLEEGRTIHDRGK